MIFFGGIPYTSFQLFCSLWVWFIHIYLSQNWLKVEKMTGNYESWYSCLGGAWHFVCESVSLSNHKNLPGVVVKGIWTRWNPQGFFYSRDPFSSEPSWFSGCACIFVLPNIWLSIMLNLQLQPFATRSFFGMENFLSQDAQPNDKQNPSLPNSCSGLVFRLGFFEVRIPPHVWCKPRGSASPSTVLEEY